MSENKISWFQQHPILTTSGTIFITSIVLYSLAIGQTIDLIDDTILFASTISVISTANAIVSIETMVLFAAFYIASVSTLRDLTGALASFLAMGIAWVLMLVISFLSLLFLKPQFVLTIDNWWFLSTLFYMSVLRNPGLGLVIMGIILIISLIISTKLSGVE